MHVGKSKNGSRSDLEHSDLDSIYLTTKEAAAYLRKSTSWLLRQTEIPYLRGNPHVYKAADLDAWFDRSKQGPDI